MAISIQDIVAPQSQTAVPAPAQASLPAPGFLQEPLTPKDESKAQIPDAVLNIPAFRTLLEGTPPAVSASIAEVDSDPTLKVLQANVEPLLYSGFGFYRAKDGQRGVFYNGQFIDGNAIKLADDQGKLDTVSTPFSELKSFFDANIGEAAVEGAAPAAAPTSQPMGAPAPASSQTRLANARINNLEAGSPTSGPVPGGGRVLNNILKPTV